MQGKRPSTLRASRRCLILGFMPSLRSSTTSEIIAFDQRLRVGRAEGNDLRIDLSTVSGDHAILEVRDGGLFVRDLGSTNGTRVRGRKVLTWTKLGVGEAVRFGPDSSWEVVSVEDEVDSTSATPRVIVVQSGRTFPIGEDRFVIGSSPTADLRIEELPGVAAVIVVEDGARWLIPMEEEDARQQLASADAFAVGDVQLRYLDESGGQLASTVPEKMRSRSYGLDLNLVHERPGEGRIEIDTGGDQVVFDGVPNRFVLLLVLARALRGRYPAGCDEQDGWVDDEPIRIALWGRPGAAARYNSALTKVIYDTRRMIAARGIDPFFIEKSRGRTRLRLDPGRVDIEGE